MFEGILGHKRQLELLEKAVRNGKLAHAYVFAGPEGVGKKLVAQKIAAEMLSKTSDFHPDFLEVNEQGIKIEQIRDLTYKLSLMPYQAKYKVALIDNAHEMTTEASNALLKSLEEPKAHTYIFLITSNPSMLPKTILSRCQKINFGLVKKESEVTENQFLADEYLETFLSDDAASRLIAAYDIADLETDQIKKILDFWIMNLRKKLQEHASKILAKKIFAVMQARKFLEQNVNPKLLLTNLMLATQ